MSRGQGWYAQRKQERILKPGDRIAVLGRGVAVVKRVDNRHIYALLWNRSGLRIRRSEIVWVEQNIAGRTSAHTGTLRVPQCILPVGREHCLALPTSPSFDSFGLGCCLVPYFCTGVNPATLQPPRCPVAAASEQAREAE